MKLVSSWSAVSPRLTSAESKYKVSVSLSLTRATWCHSPSWMFSVPVRRRVSVTVGLGVRKTEREPSLFACTPRRMFSPLATWKMLPAAPRVVRRTQILAVKLKNSLPLRRTLLRAKLLRVGRSKIPFCRVPLPEMVMSSSATRYRHPLVPQRSNTLLSYRME